MGFRRSIANNIGSVEVFTSDSGDGDFQIRKPAPDVEHRRRQVVDAPWTWVRQVHGDRVLAVEHPGHHAGTEADGLITAVAGCPIAVTTADCAPLVLVAQRGVGIVHAGWKGLNEGIVEKAARSLRELAGDPVDAILGPCIHPGRYEFGSHELDLISARYGPGVRAETEWGTAALDLPEAIGEACRGVGWAVSEVGACTSDPGYFSHRTRGDQQRQTTVAWIEP